MKILSSIYNSLLIEMPNTPPEIGGIFGGKEGVITEYCVDVGSPSIKGCYYTPNIRFLNSVIAEWQEQGLDFAGVFHTHFFGVDTLSEGDCRYIEAIMRAIPRSIAGLYFPLVVMPEKYIVPYFAECNGEKISINKRELIIM